MKTNSDLMLSQTVVEVSIQLKWVLKAILFQIEFVQFDISAVVLMVKMLHVIHNFESQDDSYL